jgi:hypothetical protein
MFLECSEDRPWGVHPKVFNDAECPRCGWTAPGPKGDAAEAAAAEADERERIRAWAAELGLQLMEYGIAVPEEDDPALAA